MAVDGFDAGRADAPIITLALIGLHILMVQYHGMSTPLSLQGEKKREIPFFPNVFYKDLMIWLVVVRPVTQLSELADRVSQGDLAAPEFSSRSRVRSRRVPGKVIGPSTIALTSFMGRR